MGIIETMASAPGTHPSRASSMTRIECDRCDREFRADCNIDGIWKLHGEDVGMTDYSGSQAEELCQECADELFAD